jgi:hypothetical protein
VDLGALFAAEATRPLVVCDIDNVLAYQAEAVCTAVNARFGTSYLVERMTTYPVANLLEPEQRQWLVAASVRDPWILNMAPDREAIAALNTIRRSGHRIVIASDRPAQCAAATVRWLDAHQVPRDDQILNGPGSKQRALAACGPATPGILADDDPSKWLTIARPGVEVWCPRRPWTPQQWRQYPNVRVFTVWAELLNRLGIS